MSFAARLLTNFPLVNILFSVVLIMGTLAFVQMPREQDPEINFNWVNIATTLPGASAEDVERLVTSPLEDALRNVQDVRWVTSSSRESASNILIRFRDIGQAVFDKRMNDLRREVQNASETELPAEANAPFILEVTTSNGFPTALVVVTGQGEDELLWRTARLVKDDLARISGVDQVSSFGLSDAEMVVEFDPNSIAARGMRPSDVSDSLRSMFRDTSAGTVDVSGEEWLVRVEGKTTDPHKLSEYRIAPMGQPQNRIALDVVADVERTREAPAQMVSFNGQPAVSLSITKVSYTNTIELVDRVREYIETKNEQLSDTGLELVLADDQTVMTQQALGVMQTNAGLGLLLVLLVCWLFLGLKIATMVALGIVFSIAGTLWLLQITGNTLNISVLLGIVIVLGMLVDDAVVVVEAVYYRLVRGVEAVDAALAALAEVGQPVTSAVATTIAAFLPLMLLPGIVGEFMFVIPFVVAVGLAVSLVEAFWILPAHAISSANSVSAHRNRPGFRERQTRRLRRWYTKALCHVIRRPIRYLFAFLVALTLAVSALALGMIRIEFFTFDPVRLFYVTVETPSDTPLHETLKRTKSVEQKVLEHLDPGEARAVTVIAGSKFTEVEPVVGDQFGQIQVSLEPLEGGVGRQPGEIIEAMRADLEAMAGDFSISFLEISGGPPAGSPIDVKVRGDDLTEIRAAADAVKRIVENIEGTKDITDNDIAGRSEVLLEVDHAAAQRAGIDPGELARTVRLLFDGEVIGLVRDRGEKVELRVRGPQLGRDDVQTILSTPIAIGNGRTTTLGSLVEQRVRTGRGVIRHHNFRRSITVKAGLDPLVVDTVKANETLRAAWAQIASEYPNTNLDFSGELDDIQESLDAMLGLFALGVGLIYLILATQFRSYFQPFLILVTVPMAFTGVVVGLLITGHPLSLYTLYGVVALTGIAVNSAIVLIDAANQRVAAGMSAIHAAVFAARRRVIPIAMTTSTTIAGLSSLALGLGGESLLWGPVASSIVAGLAFASVLTLFVIPVLYRLFMQRVVRKRRAQQALEQAVPA